MTSVFLECTNPNCLFRFPVPPNTSKPVIACPKCESELTSQPDSTNNQWNPREISPNGPAVEGLLDNIRSTFNVGAMFRTADGAGLRHLHLSGITPLPENPKVAKTALGAEYSVPWTYHPNGLTAAKACKDQGMRIWSVEIGASAISIFDAVQELQGPPILLVIGNEVSGIDPGIQSISDRLIWLPMQGFKRSLNAAIAFGIAAYFLSYGSHLPKYNIDPALDSR